MKRRKFDPAYFLFNLVLIMGTAALLVKCSQPAKAGQGEVTWTAPTQYCDGRPLPAIAGYEILYTQKKVDVLGSARTYTITGLLPGEWFFSIAARDMAGNTSNFSTASKIVKPEEFVTKTTKVYTFFRSNGNISVAATTHTVPLGTVCDPTQSVNGKYKIPLGAVTWSGTKLTAALADCG